VNPEQRTLNAYSKLRSKRQSCLPARAWVKWHDGHTLAAVALGLTLLCGLASAEPVAPTGPDPSSCRTVRFSDVGWTDVTATTALATTLLQQLGYSPQITVLSVPVTFASLQNKDIDVFLGNWMPAQQADRSKYIADGTSKSAPISRARNTHWPCRPTPTKRAFMTSPISSASRVL
jgi:ABC-type proline/glycine betaine transport system substrate-binding protein